MLDLTWKLGREERLHLSGKLGRRGRGARPQLEVREEGKGARPQLEVGEEEREGKLADHISIHDLAT